MLFLSAGPAGCVSAIQRPIVQSIVSLMVKYMPTNLSNTLLFFVEKITVYL